MTVDTKAYIADLTKELEQLWRQLRTLNASDYQPGKNSSKLNLSPELNRPAGRSEIEAVERFYNVSLPLDYVEFLMIHNGWRELDGSSLLSTEQMMSGEMYQLVEEIKQVWRLEGDEVLPDGIPIFAGRDVRAFVFFNRHTEPMRVHDYTDNLLYQNFTVYLEEWVAKHQKWIDECS